LPSAGIGINLARMPRCVGRVQRIDRQIYLAILSLLRQTYASRQRKLGRRKDTVVIQRGAPAGG